MIKSQSDILKKFWVSLVRKSRIPYRVANENKKFLVKDFGLGASK